MDQNFRFIPRSCASNSVTRPGCSPWATVSPADSLPPPSTAVFLPEEKKGRTEAVDPKTIQRLEKSEEKVSYERWTGVESFKKGHSAALEPTPTNTDS